METIGKQVRLPINTAFQIAMQGIKIRLGRAVVTISGVVLGIAFLMSILTGNLITRAVAKEQEFQQKLKVMNDAVTSSVGTLQGKQVGIAILGNTNDAMQQRVEQAFLRKIAGDVASSSGAEKTVVHAYHLGSTGITIPGSTEVTDLATLGQGCDLVILLGDDKNCVTPYADLTRGMKQLAVLDTQTARTFAGKATSNTERDLFFGEAADEQRLQAMETAKSNAARTHWIVLISLLVTVIGIANALLMSVTERFKEIGTMKCLGALSGFIRQLFLIESLFIGLVGSLLGIIIGILFPAIAYTISYGMLSSNLGYGATLVFSAFDYQLVIFSLECLGAGCLLSVIAAIYPATIAARMIPAMALRSNV